MSTWNLCPKFCYKLQELLVNRIKTHRLVSQSFNILDA